MLGYEIPIIKEVFVIARCIFLTIPFMWRDVLAYFLFCVVFLLGLWNNVIVDLLGILVWNFILSYQPSPKL